MLHFPTNLSVGTAYTATEIFAVASNAGAGWAALEGTVDLSDEVHPHATITRAFFDDGDIGMAPNLVIEGLSFFEEYGYWSGYLELGNFSHVLADMLAGNDTITGSAAADYIIGFGGNDVIRGGGGADAIDGSLGNDTMFGNGGNDLIGGSAGRDVLIGGLGADDLCPYAYTGIGNDGVRDIVRFTSLADSGTTATTRDEIFGFIKGTSLAADRIDLSPIDANPSLAGNQAFHFVTSFTAAKGEVRLVTSGANTIVQVDGDSDLAVDMTILVHNAVLHAFDLIL